MLHSHANAIDELSTKEEVLREFCIFYMNHRDERLFRHEEFTKLLKQTHGTAASDLSNMLIILRSASITHVYKLLRECRNAAMLSSTYEKLLTRPALLDLHALISYVKLCLVE